MLTALTAHVVVSPCFAAEDVVGANVLGMAGVSVADVTDNAAITVNPGMMALRKRYDFHGHYTYGPAGGSHWGATAMDGQTSKFLWMGLAYSGDLYRPELQTTELPGWKLPDQDIQNKKRNHDFTLAFGLPLIGERLSLGINGGVSLFNNDRQGKGLFGNADVGLGVLPTTWLAIGLVGENLLPLSGPRSTGAQAGVRLFQEEFGAFEIDGGYLHGDSDGINLGVGAEKNAGMARVRLGYGIDLPTRDQHLSWGLGLLGDGGSFEYGMTVPVGAKDGVLSGLVNQLSLHLKAPDTSLSGGF
jgi:hypothetical protein